MTEKKREERSLFRLLDRPIEEDELREWTAQVAALRGDAKLDTQSVLIFRIGSEWVALLSSLVVEIAEPRRFHRLPHRPHDIVLGLVNVRGRLVPCVSPARFLNIEVPEEVQAAGPTRHRLIVVGEGQSRLAIPASEVHGIHRFSASDLQAVPSTVAQSGHISGILAWNGKSVGYIDAKLLVDFLKRSLS